MARLVPATVPGRIQIGGVDAEPAGDRGRGNRVITGDHADRQQSGSIGVGFQCTPR